MDHALARPYWTVRYADGVWWVFRFYVGGFNMRMVTPYGWPKLTQFSDN